MLWTFNLSFIVDILAILGLATVLATFSKLWVIFPIIWSPCYIIEEIDSHCFFISNSLFKLLTSLALAMARAIRPAMIEQVIKH